MASSKEGPVHLIRLMCLVTPRYGVDRGEKIKKKVIPSIRERIIYNSNSQNKGKIHIKRNVSRRSYFTKKGKTP